MRFQTGDIAEFMDMTNMGVIYLEKRGVIQSRREPNGYRSFDLDTITKLGIIRSYERVGFSLEEAVNLTTLPVEAVSARLEEKQQQILRQLELVRFLQKEVSHPLVGEAPLSRDNARLITMPALYYCPVWEDKYDAADLPGDVWRLLRRIDVSWISAMPYMRYCSKMRWDGQCWQAERGNCIPARYAEEMGVLLPEEWVEYVSSRRCLCYYGATGDFSALLQKGQAYLDTLGLSWSATAYLPLMIRYPAAKAADYTVCVYLPLAE